MELVPYSDSNTSDSEAEAVECIVNNPAKKPRLPAAKQLLGNKIKVEDDETYNSNPALHQNRVRSFKHERGNWATFVYVQVNDSIFDEIAELCQRELSSIELQACNDFHLTLSRTVVLQYHLIDNFVKSLEQAVLEKSFPVFLGDLEVYVNEDKTRTFIGYKVETSLKLLELLKKVDKVMLDFKLQTFYEDPSFHISFAWCLGNKLDLIKPDLVRLMTTLELLFTNSTTKSFIIRELRCKIGHKIYNFSLS